MHEYLRSIGFAETFDSEYDLDMFLDGFFTTYEHRRMVRDAEGKRTFVELSRTFGPDLGVRVCGELDEHGFHRQYYFPYLAGSGTTCEGELTVNRRLGGDDYSAMCEDGRVGVSLIFYLQNPADYRQENQPGKLKSGRVTTTLCGLAKSGMILLPKKPETGREQQHRQQEFYRRHDSLVAAARDGDQEAIESLTLEDMDTCAMLSRRIIHEDVLSIVDSYFMPSGMECDLYQVLGTILFHTRVTNSMTQQEVYQLTVDCNGMIFDIAVNAADLLGEPAEGRRFKGNIWLQGRLNYES